MQPGITAEDINGQSYLVEHIKAVLKLKLYRYRTLRDALPNASDLAVDLISKMLTFDPKYRITAADALKHPYFEGLYQPSDVIVPPIYTL
jgi:serine/threonine protein kinase